MSTNNNSLPAEDPQAVQADSQLREIFASLPDTGSELDLTRRVLARIQSRKKQGRKIIIRSAAAASLLLLLATFWFLISGDRDPQRVKKDPPAVQSVNEVELFAFAYQGFSSPVVQLDELETESQAWLSYLDSLAATEEK